MDMEEHDLDDGPPHKRRRFESIPTVIDETVNEKETGIPKETVLKGLDRPISPPLVRRRGATKALSTQLHQQQEDEIAQAAQDKDPQNKHVVVQNGSAATKITFISSPIQLTRIRDLAPAQNVDTVSLREILSDSLIKECWNINFLFDVDFVM
jgi:tyrosyl-DNA phosphodiesterase-1